MKKCYDIIIDQQELQKFIDFLPENETNDTQYYVCLFARKKYGEAVFKADKGQLKRFTTTKDRLISKLRQLEIPTGYYKVLGVSIPSENIAVYISTNPRSMELASLVLMEKLVKMVVTKDYLGNPQALALTSIIKSKPIGDFYDFDIDLITPATKQIIGPQYFMDKWGIHEGLTFIETHGGYHCLVDVLKTVNKKWFLIISNDKDDSYTIDKKGKDNLIPIPGCRQSNFSPKLIN